MKGKVFTLSSCDTSKRILKAAGIDSANFEIVDIKSEGIKPEDLEQMKALAGTYEALFSKRAQLYKTMGLKDKQLSEEDIRDLILQHYTFLKRPVIIVGKRIFIGNAKKNVAALVDFLR
jgi:arsenate reductase